jgi:hypothetical protein
MAGSLGDRARHGRQTQRQLGIEMSGQPPHVGDVQGIDAGVSDVQARRREGSGDVIGVHVEVDVVHAQRKHIRVIPGADIIVGAGAAAVQTGQQPESEAQDGITDESHVQTSQAHRTHRFLSAQKFAKNPRATAVQKGASVE